MLPEPARWKRALREPIAKPGCSRRREEADPARTGTIRLLTSAATVARRSFAIASRSAGILPAGSGGILAASSSGTAKMCPIPLARKAGLESIARMSNLIAMKFFGAILAYLFIGAFLGWGILLAAAKGNYWLLGISLLVYIVAFAKIGCLPPGKSH